MSRSHDIEVRKLQFCLPKELPRYWNGGSGVRTHLFNALAVMTPAFEGMVISSAKTFVSKLPAAKRETLQGFIGQESAHGSEYIRYNRILKGQGYPVKRLEKQSLSIFKWFSNKLSSHMHLSIAVGTEHWLAILGDKVLRDPKWLEGATPDMAAIWRWHFMEEIDHKSVLFDVYQTVDGSYLKRAAGMLVVSFLFTLLVAKNFFALSRQDGMLGKKRFWVDGLSLLFGKGGVFRQFFLPFCRYFHPRFHPWQTNNYALIDYWKAKYRQQGARGLIQLLKEQEAVCKESI